MHRARLNRAYTWQKKGDIQKRLADYDEAIRLDPKYALAWTNRGVVWENKGELDKALADYKEVVQLEPKSASARTYRGNVFLQKGEPRQSHGQTTMRPFD